MPTRRVPSGKVQARRWDKTRSTYVSIGTYADEAEAQKALDRADLIEEMGLVPESSGTKKTPRGSHDGRARSCSCPWP